MKNDIFIDNNIAKNFANPVDPEYIKLINWLLGKNNNEAGQKAHLVVSNKLLMEYYASSRNATTATCIPTLIDILTREGRLIKKSNSEIKAFMSVYFTKKTIKNLRCNIEDRNHIPVVLLSDRKYALTIDDDFIYDIVNFPGFAVTVSKRPENIDYNKF